MSRLREQMPTIAKWIDSMRDAFGADQVDPSIAAGMRGEPKFWASENGVEVGTKKRALTEKTWAT